MRRAFARFTSTRGRIGAAVWLAFAAAGARAEPVLESGRVAAPAASLVATSGGVDSVGEMTRVSFVVNAPFDVTAFALADPDRVVVEMPAVNFLVDPAIGQSTKPAVVAAPARTRRSHAGRAAVQLVAAPVAAGPLAGVVNSFRFGQFAPGRSRLVVDLARPARVARALVEPFGEGRFRLILELAPTDRAAFVAAVHAAAAPPPAAPKPVASALAETLPIVVVDAGHGGVDDGAHSSSGVVEKDIVLEFAQGLAARLEKSGRYKVVMTRATDVFIPLSDRVKIAREAGAALFVSIHADTLADEPQVAGATVYTVSDKASDAAAARLADKENQSDAIAGVDAGEDAGEVADILFDLTRRETRAFSQVFARTLVDYVGAVARLNKNARRAAGFRVLKAPDVPSVLLELGYLSSAGDVPNLVSADWRSKVSGAVSAAIDKFFQARTANARAVDVAGELKASFDEAGAQAR